MKTRSRRKRGEADAEPQEGSVSEKKVKLEETEHDDLLKEFDEMSDFFEAGSNGELIKQEERGKEDNTFESEPVFQIVKVETVETEENMNDEDRENLFKEKSEGGKSRLLGCLAKQEKRLRRKLIPFLYWPKCGGCKETFSNVTNLQQHHQENPECGGSPIFCVGFRNVCKKGLVGKGKGMRIHFNEAHGNSKEHIKALQKALKLQTCSIPPLCTECSYKPDSLEDYCDHLKSHTEFLCKSCGKESSDARAMKNHIRECHQSMIRCKSCEVEKPTAATFQAHITRCHDLGAVCKICGRYEKNALALYLHSTIMHGDFRDEATVNCTGEAAIEKVDMNEKMITIQGNPAAKNTLKAGEKGKSLVTRKGQSPAKGIKILFQCEDCGIVYRSQAMMKRHRTQHDRVESDKNQKIGPKAGPEAAHKCEICEKEFEGENDLTGHYRSFHDGRARPGTQCTQCGLSFKSEIDLVIHARVDHEAFVYQLPIYTLQSSEFGCMECNRKFLCKERMEFHFSNFHSHGNKSSSQEFSEDQAKREDDLFRLAEMQKHRQNKNLLQFNSIEMNNHIRDIQHLFGAKKRGKRTRSSDVDSETERWKKSKEYKQNLYWTKNRRHSIG